MGGQPEESREPLSKMESRRFSLKRCASEYPDYIELGILLLILEPQMIRRIFRILLVLKNIKTNQT